MPYVLNKAAGPRIFNVKKGEVVEQRTLQPGEGAELEVADAEGEVFKAWVEAGEVEVGGEPAEAGYDAEKLAEAEAKAAEALGEVEALAAERQAVETDAARRTPPRQLAGDGGPEQVPTVDGNPGAPTKPQVEAEQGDEPSPRRGRRKE